MQPESNIYQGQRLTFRQFNAKLAALKADNSPAAKLALMQLRQTKIIQGIKHVALTNISIDAKDLYKLHPKLKPVIAIAFYSLVEQFRYLWNENGDKCMIGNYSNEYLFIQFGERGNKIQLVELNRLFNVMLDNKGKLCIIVNAVKYYLPENHL